MPVYMSTCLSLVEKFVVLLYDKSSDCLDVNAARKDLFCRKSRTLSNIPPTQSALVEHTKRAAFQAGHIWEQSLIARPEIPSPDNWGWVKGSDGWKPRWMTLPDASRACHQLIKCGCKQVCKANTCSCGKAGLRCTDLCFCAGGCNQEDIQDH